MVRPKAGGRRRGGWPTAAGALVACAAMSGAASAGADTIITLKSGKVVSLPVSRADIQSITDSVGAERLSPAERAAAQRDQTAVQQRVAADERDRMQLIDKAVQAATAAAKAAAESAQAAARSANSARKASEAAAQAVARVEELRRAGVGAPPPRLPPAPAAHLPPAPRPRAEPAPRAAGPAGAAAKAGGPIVLCAQGDPSQSCTTTDLNAAFRAAGNGSTITIRPGKYFQAGVLTAPNVTIQAKGAHFEGAAAEGKATFVLRGGNTTVIGLECSGVAVRDKNGACIRLEKPGLVLRDVYFHDNQEGILTVEHVGTVLIEDSLFEHNGANHGQAHQIYVGAADLLTIRHTRVLAATGEGHEVKSRADKTVIEDSVIAALDAQDSRALDASNGGEVIIRNSVIERGPKTENSDLVGYAFEKKSSYGPSNNSITFTGNTILVDRPGGAMWIRGRDIGKVTIKDNVIVGPMEGDKIPGNKYYRSRADAGFPPFPALSKK